MNETEVAELFAYFGTAWPEAKVNPGQIKVWAGQLANVDPMDGETAANELVGSLKWFPSIAEFRSAAAGALRRREASQRGLPAGTRPGKVERLETAKVWLDVAREALRKQAAGELVELPDVSSHLNVPSCPRCSGRGEVEPLGTPVGGHDWLCGWCWTTFAGTENEWHAMRYARKVWEEQHQGAER